MKLRIVAAATTALALTGGLLAGCSSSPSTAAGSASGPGTNTTQTVSFTGSDGAATYAPVIKAFEAKYPKITIKYTQLPQTSFSSTMQQRLSGKDSSIDVYTVDAGDVPELAAQGFLVDLSALKAQTKAITSSDEYKTNLFRGKQWALPVWTSTQLLFYNKGALTKAGVKTPSLSPSEPMSWEQLAIDAAAVQKKGGTQSGVLFEQPAAYYELQPLAESLGGGSGVTGSNGLSTDINNAGWTKAMEWYSSLYKSGVAPRVPNLQSQAYFLDGKTGYYIGGPWDVGIFASSKLSWGIAPLPKFATGKQVTPTGSWSWGISPYSKHQAAALAFAKFASLTTEGNRATTEATTIIPANTKAAADYLPSLEKLAGSKSAGVTAIMTYQTHTAVNRPNTVGYVQFESIADKAFSDIQNGADVPSRLAQLKQQIQVAWKSLK